MLRSPALLALLALLAACQSGASSKAATGDARAGSGSVEGPSTRIVDVNPRPGYEPPAVPLPRDGGIKLLEPGAEPRAKLRYTLTAPTERVLTAELVITSRTFSDSVWTRRVDLPAVRQRLGVLPAPGQLQLRPLPVEIDAGGDAVVRGLVERSVERWSTLLERRRINAAVDDRGRLSALAFADYPGEPGLPSTTADPARDELWQILLGIAVPLPDEAVGVGAKWRASVNLRAGTATIQQTTDYTLTKVEGDTWTLEITSRRIGERQEAAAVSLPPGTKAELIGLFREVRGSVTVRAADPLPIAADLDTEVRIHAQFTVPGRDLVETASEDVGTVTITSQ